MGSERSGGRCVSSGKMCGTLVCLNGFMWLLAFAGQCGCMHVEWFGLACETADRANELVINEKLNGTEVGPISGESTRFPRSSTVVATAT